MKNKKWVTVLDAGRGWLAIDKPPGVSVHNEPGNDLSAFVNHTLNSDAGLRNLTGWKEGSAASPVHRLDRETSGVMVFGLSRSMLAWFAEQFEQRRVEKSYVALVHGVFEDPLDQGFEWSYPLTQAAGGRRMIEGAGKKVNCLTRVRVMQKSGRYSLLICEPMTGRTHQIRRHAALAGHPVLGDERYGSKRAVTYLKTHGLFDRLGLHAHALSFFLPGEGGKKTCISPFPGCFKDLMANDGLLV